MPPGFVAGYNSHYRLQATAKGTFDVHVDFPTSPYLFQKIALTFSGNIL